ncbi:MAG: CDP-archaeol synthase [Planctomycetes bacterium]|nr:CDP-archaeol synthase [Planctomycetota bacterium]
MWSEPLRVLWLAFPVMFAAAIHIVVLRLKLMEGLKKPLDGGRTWRGRRIFGDNKTIRGALIMVAASVIGAMLQGVLRVRALEYFDYGRADLPLVGFLLGLGFVAAELPNSFLKRRFDVKPGQRGGPIFVILDQIDSVIGGLGLLCFVWLPPARVWILALLLCSLAHIAFNGVFVMVGLKKSVF